MKRIALILILLFVATAASAQNGYDIVRYRNSSNWSDPVVGEEVIPIECGTASSWGVTTNYKIITTYDCNGQEVNETCWRFLFGAWRQQYC